MGPNNAAEAYTENLAGRKEGTHLPKAIQPRNDQMPKGTMSIGRNPTPNGAIKVSSRRIGRGQRAWRALKGTHATGEELNSPAALTARAKRERGANDKKVNPMGNRFGISS